MNTKLAAPSLLLPRIARHHRPRPLVRLTTPVLVVAFALSLGPLAASARAQVATWNNTGGTVDFNTATNWSANTLPGTSSVATFATAASVQPNVSASLAVSGLDFSTTASGGYVLSATNGAALTLLSTATGSAGALHTASTGSANQITAPLFLGAASGATQTITQSGTGGLLLDSVIGSTAGVTVSFSATGNINIFHANTYSGPTTISGAGNVVATTIGNSGTAGNLGAGSTINLGLGSASGSLLYGGNAGETTNRTINLNANGAGATINRLGSGALIFSSDFTATGTGSKTLTLTGTSTGANALQGAIVDGNGTTSLAKTGTGTWALSGANTYTGPTTVFAGTLVVTSLADGGTASAVGASSNAAANLEILLGGTLKYTGAAASTDRLFTVAGGSGTLDASGSGALHLTNAGNIAFSGGARTLTLTGTNTGANTLAAALADLGATTALTKNGAGTWLLTGTHTYTGATTLNAGTLSLLGSLAGTAITVHPGATFSGNGTATGSLTLHSGGLLAPGNGLGSLAVGGFNWNGGGLLNFELGTGNASDRLNIAGALAKGGSGFVFDFLTGGTAANTYTLLNFGSTTGGFTVADFSYTNLAPGLTGAFTLHAGSLDFTTSAIPEPSTYAAFLAAAALLGTVLHRRRADQKNQPPTTGPAVR